MTTLVVVAQVHLTVALITVVDVAMVAHRAVVPQTEVVAPAPTIRHVLSVKYVVRLAIWQRLVVMRISTRGTTPHGLRRTKEGSVTTWPTIQKISENHGVLPKA
jgi:hypothetical protein